MSQIHFKTWTLDFTESWDKNLPNGMKFDPWDNAWFTKPTVIAQLPTPTFGALRELFKEVMALDQESVDKLGIPLRRFKELMEQWASLSDDVEIYRRPTPPPGNTSCLFDEQPVVTNPVFEYDGIWSLTSSTLAVRIHAYPSSNYDDTSGVQAWNHRPDFEFFSCKKEKTKLYFGLELEVNTKLPWSDIRRVMLDVEPKQPEFLYAMSDSSISGKFDNCYEIVSMPMTPRRMRQEYKKLFAKLSKLLDAKGLAMDEVFDMDTRSTGIHVHTSANAYGKLQRRKFTAMWNSDIPSILNTINLLAGRKLTETQYCKPSPAYEGRRVGYSLKEVRYTDKYAACNDTGHSQTVEVRVFKGTPTLKNILGCIDTVEAMFNFTAEMPNSAFSNTFPKVFHTWLYSQPAYKYRDLKERIQCA